MGQSDALSYADATAPPMDAETYLLTVAGDLHGPFARFADATTDVFGDVSGDVDLAFGSFRSVALIRTGPAPGVWRIVGEISLLTQKRADRIIDFFRAAGAGQETPIILAPHGAEERHTTVLARLPAVFDFLRRRSFAMKIDERPLDDIRTNKMANGLIVGWSDDNYQWGRSINNLIDYFSIKDRIVSVNVERMTFDWSGSALTLLDENPTRLVNAPLTSLMDKSFVDGIALDLRRATAVERPYLCHITTPLNGVQVEYDLLSLPLRNGASKTVTSCLRIPLELTVKSLPPAHFDPEAGSLPTKMVLPRP